MAEDHIKAKVHQAFTEMDKSGDGKVSFSEFSAYCRRVPGMENIAQVFNQTDTSDDFMIDEEELFGMMGKVPAKEIKGCHVRDLFKELDTSGDGFLSKSEFRTFMLGLGYSGDMLENTIEAVVGDDDKVSVDEFLAQWQAE